MIRWLKEMLLLNIMLVPPIVFFPAICWLLAAQPDPIAAQACFWFAPLRAGLLRVGVQPMVVSARVEQDGAAETLARGSRRLPMYNPPRLRLAAVRHRLLVPMRGRLRGCLPVSTPLRVPAGIVDRAISLRRLFPAGAYLALEASACLGAGRSCASREGKPSSKG